MSNLFPENFQLLEKMLDYSALRQKVIAHNIANVNTPGFRRSDVTFDGELKKALKNKDNLSKLEAKIYKPDIAATRSDNNNVDIEKEFGKLSENALLYQTYIWLISRRLRGLKEAIKSGSDV